MIRIAVNGAAGRMGQRILVLAKESGRFEIAGQFDAVGGAHGTPLQSAALTGKGVLIDFSSAEGTSASLQAALAAEWGLVVGTTGLDDLSVDKLKAASAKIPIVRSSNMSVGVNLALELVAETAKKLSGDFKIKIYEAHHVHKKDAPSGTALMLKKALADAKGWDKVRADQEIEMDVKREGEIIGDHTVYFTGPAETIEITHHAHSRDTFARGALVAAEFVSKRAAGLYTMQDVLNPPAAGMTIQ